MSHYHRLPELRVLARTLRKVEHETEAKDEVFPISGEFSDRLQPLTPQ